VRLLVATFSLAGMTRGWNSLLHFAIFLLHFASTTPFTLPKNFSSFLTVHFADEIASKDRVSIIYSGYVREAPILWKIPSYEKTITDPAAPPPPCHLKLYGVALEENLLTVLKSGAARLFLESIPETSLGKNIAPHVTCFYLTNRGAYSDVQVSPLPRLW
jgi:hypothetical protein